MGDARRHRSDPGRSSERPLPASEESYTDVTIEDIPVIGNAPAAELLLDSSTLDRLASQGLVVQRADDLSALMRSARYAFAPSAPETAPEAATAAVVSNRSKPPAEVVNDAVKTARAVLASSEVKRRDVVTGDFVVCPSPRRTK